MILLQVKLVVVQQPVAVKGTGNVAHAKCTRYSQQTIDDLHDSRALVM